MAPVKLLNKRYVQTVLTYLTIKIAIWFKSGMWLLRVNVYEKLCVPDIDLMYIVVCKWRKYDIVAIVALRALLAA